jgi:hypothetical protein
MSHRRCAGSCVAALFLCACASDDVAVVPDAGAAVDASGEAAAPFDASADVAADADAAPVDPCLGRIICDDFEKATTGAAPLAPWKTQLSKGTVLVDESRAYSGKRSVKVSVTATTANDTYRQAYLAITGAPLIPLAGNSVYGRFMISTDRIPASSVHWTIASGSGPIGNLYAVYNYGGWQTEAQAFPTAKWTCVGFQLDGTNNEMRFWLDGVEVPELHVLGNTKTDLTCTVKGVDGRWLAPKFDAIKVGWESYQHDAVGAHDAWIDDVILDDTPIACP